MSIHDKMAFKAASMGKTSAEFHASAQRHANATWGSAILAGVVWYFAGWLWALIPAAIGLFTIAKSASSTMIATRLEKAEQSGEGDEE